MKFHILINVGNQSQATDNVEGGAERWLCIDDTRDRKFSCDSKKVDSAMPPKVNPIKTQEKIDGDLRKISRIEGNKTCVDCPEKMPGYVNLTHNTFVCIKCSGIHRELQYKIKGISMSVFTADDVANMGAGGNVAFNLMYLNRFQSTDYTLPNGSDIGKLREFIKRKYIEKKWYSDEISILSKSVPSSSAYTKQADFKGPRKYGPVSTSTDKGATSCVSKAGLDLMSMSPLSPTTGSSSSLKSCSDPFRFQPPTVQTSGIGSSTEQQMRFNAFSSPTNQQQIVSSFAAVESRGGKAAPHSSYSNGSSLAASGLSFPMHGGLSNVPTQGYALDPRSSFPCPPPSMQSQVSANPFDSPASVVYVKALSSTAGSGHYGEPTPRQMQYPYSSYYQSPPGQGPGQGPGSAPRQVQGPSPGPSSGQVQGQSLAHTQPALSQHLSPQHQHQNQRNFDQRQYDQSYPAPSYPPTGHLQSQRPPIFTHSGIGSTVLSPGPLRAQVPIDPFSSVDALSWGLGVKKNDPNALSQVATPSSVIYSPTCTREPPKKSNETYYHYSQPSQHSSLSHPVHPPHVVKESTNPFDLY